MAAKKLSAKLSALQVMWFVVNGWALTFQMPRRSRGPQAPPEVWRFAGLDDVAPGLSEAFLDSEFRSALRTAGRRDLGETEDRDKFLGKNPTTKERFGNLDDVLRPLDIRGEDFVKNIAGLRLNDQNVVLGDWLDTTAPDSKFWHQDSAVDGAQDGGAPAIILGFPSDDYDGSPVDGVFPNLVPLSHAFHDDDTILDLFGRPTRSKKYAVMDHILRPALLLQDINDDDILRPPFQRGNEILLYYDAFTFHRSPDRGPRRHGIWRFM